MALNIRFDHAALSVSSLEKSMAFYVDLLGFEKSDVIECPPEGGLGNVVGLPGCRARIAKLKQDALTLELFEYLDPRGRPLTPDRTQADLGLTHLGFTSADIHADCQRLRQKGVEFYSPPIEYRPHVWNAYFYGPDGETCELRQFTG
ncbi:MAG: VOC family protein [Terriglobia bacterium]|jgi:catechol 2,3-dioxygenase-like lactoylglutathione lyase family enzyme